MQKKLNSHDSRKSPLKDAPLRQPGQSVREQWQRVLAKDMVFVIVAMGALGFALGVGVGAISGRWWILMLAVSAIVAACTMVLAFRRLNSDEGSLHAYQLGAAGERTVAEVLHDLEKDGYSVIHDVPSERDMESNIDHVVIGSTGVYVIETKTRSKARGATITYDGQQLLCDGRAFDDDPIQQASMLAQELRQFFARQTSHNDLFVRPVVLFPGWFVDESKRPKENRLEWVLSPKSLAAWLAREPKRLHKDDIALLVDRLVQRVRLHERDRTAERTAT